MKPERQLAFARQVVKFYCGPFPVSVEFAEFPSRNNLAEIVFLAPPKAVRKWRILHGSSPGFRTVIKLNSQSILIPNKRNTVESMKHEVAHWLVGDRDHSRHGPEWKATFRQLLSDGRFANFDTDEIDTIIEGDTMDES